MHKEPSARSNRIWRMETPIGPAVQKVYRERDGRLRARVRSILSHVVARKTGVTAHERFVVERSMLHLWRDAGIDVPADLSERVGRPVRERTLLLEDVPGPTLHDVLCDPLTPPARRADLLARFAALWGARHALALSTGDVRFVQEHATFKHVLVCGPRLVTIDLEQHYLPRRDPRPLLAKEIAGYLRSLWKHVDEATYRRDLAVIAVAYPDPPLLRAAADHYLHPKRLLLRTLWALDRMRDARRARRRGRPHAGPRKYQALALLGEALDAAAPVPPVVVPPPPRGIASPAA